MRQAFRTTLGFGRRGPLPGEGRSGRGESWWGFAEETPQVWADWLARAWRRLSGQPLPPTPPFTLVWDAVAIPIEGVRMTFGWRWYFRCPHCDRRCLVLYEGRRGLACRRCNRLGYRSQARRIRAPLDDVLPRWGRSFVPASVASPLAEALANDIQRQLTTLFERLTVRER